MLDGISQTIFLPSCSHRVDLPAGSSREILCLTDHDNTFRTIALATSVCLSMITATPSISYCSWLRRQIPAFCIKMAVRRLTDFDVAFFSLLEGNEVQGQDSRIGESQLGMGEHPIIITIAQACFPNQVYQQVAS